VVVVQAEIIRIEWTQHEMSEDIPNLRLDVSGALGDDAYVVFAGRSWRGQFHNLTDHITIDHGQLNVHVSAEPEGWQPPHVALVGEGDYYINGVRQVSVFSPGNHEDGIIGDEQKSGGFFWVAGMMLLVTAIGLVICTCLPKERAIPTVVIAPSSPPLTGTVFPSV
jgi:hypothetical protein